MSLWKSARKFFRKVRKTTKKILPVVVAAAAIYFTAGAALGLPGAAGGWSGAVSAGVKSLGLGSGSVLAPLLTSAVTQAGYGAVGGAALAAITGTDVGKGALYGAAAGAATGTASHFLSGPPTPAAATGATATAPVMTGSPHGSGPVAASAPVTTPPVTTAGSGLLDYLNANPAAGEIAAKTVGGAVQGGFGYLASEDQIAAAEIQADLDRKNALIPYEQRAANYGSGSTGLLTKDSATSPPASISTRPEMPVGGVRYRYDPAVGAIVQVA